MNHILRAALSLMIVIGALAPAFAMGQGYRLGVDGLACPFCAYGVEKKLSEIDGVERVETSIKDGAVIVIMNDGAALDETAARQAVQDAGFTLRGFTKLPAGDTGK